MRKLTKIVIGLVVLAVVAAVLLGVFANSIAKTAIEKGGSFALGVPTTVDSVDIGFLRGTFALGGLSVQNPEGFGDGSFLHLGAASVGVAPASLRSEKVVLPELALSMIRVSLVQGPKGSNYGTILDNLERFQKKGAGSGAPAKEGPSGGTRFVVEKLRMEDVVVEVVPVPELGLAAVQVPIPTIELEGIGSDADQGVLLSELAGIVVEAILKRATATGRLPALVEGALAGDLRGLQGLAAAGVDALDASLPAGAKKGIDAAKGVLEGLGVGR